MGSTLSTTGVLKIIETKNLKVSEIVHEELGLRKRKDETFDDTLKRLLEILPSGLGELISYYPDTLQTAVREIDDIVHSAAEFNTIVTEQDGYYAYNYESPESGHIIVQARFHENPTLGVDFRYRDNFGELQHLADLGIPEDDLHDDEMVWPRAILTLENRTENIDDFELAWVKERLAPKVEGAAKRWGK